MGQTLYKFPNLNGAKSFYANHDRNHELKLVGSYKLGENWTLSSTYMFASGNPYTAPMNQYSLTMLDNKTLGYIHVGEKIAQDYQTTVGLMLVYPESGKPATALLKEAYHFIIC